VLSFVHHNTSLAAFFWRKWWLARTGLVERTRDNAKIHSEPLPLAGWGLAVMDWVCLIPVLFASLFLVSPRESREQQCFFFAKGYGLKLNSNLFCCKHGLSVRIVPSGRGFFLGAIGILIVGWLDDMHEPSSTNKIFRATAHCCPGRSFWRSYYLVRARPVFFITCLTILWILTLIQLRFNFMDNNEWPSARDWPPSARGISD